MFQVIKVLSKVQVKIYKLKGKMENNKWRKIIKKFNNWIKNIFMQEKL